MVYLSPGELAMVDRMREGLPASAWMAWLVRQEAARRFAAKPVPPKIRPRTTPQTHAAVPTYEDVDPKGVKHPPGPVTHIAPGPPESACGTHGVEGCEVCRPLPDDLKAKADERAESEPKHPLERRADAIAEAADAA